MSVTVTPLSTALGAAIEGVDMSKPVSGDNLAAMEQAMTDHLLIVIRNQSLDPDQLLAALGLFGDTMRQHLTDMLMDDHPQIAVLDSRNSPIEKDGSAIPLGSRDWHTDHTNRERPPKITALYAVNLPKSGGGDTSFANMHLAYDALPDNLKSEYAGMKTHNTIEDHGYVSAADRNQFGKIQIHPLIRTHPVTGKKAVYVHPGKTAKMDGMDVSESQVFVTDLMDRIIQPDITYRHKWQRGDLLLWDNRALLHIAHRDYDPTEGRIMHRVLLEGEVPA